MSGPYSAAVTIGSVERSSAVVFAPFVILLSLGIALARLGNGGAGSLILLGFLYFGLATAATAKRRRKRERPQVRHEVAVSEGALVVSREDERRRFELAEVRRAWALPEHGGGRVVVETRGGRRVDAWLHDLDDARTLLEALGHAPLARPMTFAFFIGLRVTVGSDGVLVAWPVLRKKRFIPHRLIEDVRWDGERVRLLLTDGHAYEIMTNGASGRNREAHDALVERLCQARDRHAANERAEVAPVLARAGRSVADWVKELRQLARGGAGYRSAAIPQETLWRVALGSENDEELRIGAGLALRAHLDAEGREKLRGAAVAAVSPRVRVALAAAADEAETDDDAVATAILERKTRIDGPG